ncbi:MAG: cytochrome oxidase subunit III [Flavobacteriaceae bacterium]|nr:cytochrome oxidase subunit III [Flavobacteriaceae bacterium]
MSDTAVFNAKSPWSGGKSPFAVSPGKLMMWVFLLSDAFTFSSLLTAYGCQRFLASSDTAPMKWPDPSVVFNHFPFLHEHLPLLFVSLMTFILIYSSVTMVLAVEAGHRMDKKSVLYYMFLTILGGIAFLSCQAWEWTMFIGGTHEGGIINGVQVFGANLNVNQYGPAAFADLFFIVTGFHGFHVLSGVVLNIIIYVNVAAGTYERRGHYEMIEKVGLYWHFVDLVWVFVFTFFYLI